MDRKEIIKNSIKKEIKDNVISKKDASYIKRKAKYNDEGQEAIADFTYDMMFGKESYKDMYKDYRD
ncbi:MAG: hypothetical protein E7162_03390 [Firmicutes bacterium]|nr:hypothetical protein [Bacillota bacterium]